MEKKKISKKRVISAIRLIIILILLLFLMSKFPIILPIFLSLLIILGLKEFYFLFEAKGIKAAKYFGIFFSLVLLWDSFIAGGDHLLGIITLIIIFTPIHFYFVRKEVPNFFDVFTTFFGIFYIGFLSTYFIKLFYISGNLSYIIYLICITSSADTGGYFFGIIFGKRKLISLISPGKTVEGLFGGIIFSLLMSFIMFKLNEGRGWWYFSLKEILILAPLIAIVGQIGDLYESSLKRFVGAKDTGNLIPEHGGILDRIDSILFTAPFFYLWLMIF